MLMVNGNQTVTVRTVINRITLTQKVVKRVFIPLYLLTGIWPNLTGLWPEFPVLFVILILLKFRVGGKNANPYWCEIRELTNRVKYPNSKSNICIAAKNAKYYRSVKYTNFFCQQFLINTRFFVLCVNIRNILFCSDW